MNCNEAKKINLLDVLNKIGAIEKKKRGNDVWYESPLRKEDIASFKVNIKKNIWYDHGEGIGGNTLDFIIRHKNCTVKEALIYLSENSFSFHQQNSYLDNQSEEKNNSEFKIVKTQNLQNKALLNYLKSRKISYEIARLYCFEIYYKNNGKRYFTIAFKNDSGGLELRNKYFKGCYQKKDITTIQNGSKVLNIFEGFFDFLSCLVLWPDKINEDFIITNSTSLVEKSIKYLDNYDFVRTFFDNDNSGKNATQLIENSCQNKFRNESLKFEGHKDLNNYVISIN